MAGEAREKCAVSAVVMSDAAELEAANLNYEMLYAMQHRGPEATGIATLDPSGDLRIHQRRGQVRDVFRKKDMARLAGSIGIGGNRYSTSGGKRFIPPYGDEDLDFAFTHNGNLPEYPEMEQFLEKHNINTNRINDSQAMQLTIGQFLRKKNDLADAVSKAYPYFTGAFSCVAMHDNSLVAFRDAYGIRPLAIGVIENEGYVVASETCGLDIVGATYLRDVEPGELVIISRDGLESRQLAEGQNKLDMFEFVYFARPDSYLYGERVNEVRRRFGEESAEQHPPITDNPENIVVLPVPETAIPEAEGYGRALGLDVVHAIVKNRYIGRTFLGKKPTRHAQLKRKHNIIAEAVEGKDVILFDDSVVRLNTAPLLVKQARDAGARSVSLIIGSPPVRFPDHYGIDTPDQSELAAAFSTIDQLKQAADLDYLGYLSLSRMIRATRQPASRFNLSCFTGEYPIDIGHHAKNVHQPVNMDYID